MPSTGWKRKPIRDTVRDCRAPCPAGSQVDPEDGKALDAGAARRFADRRETACPGAVASLRNDLDDLLACFRYKTLAGRRQVRTTNAIERRFREVRRRTRPTGTFRDRTLMDRIIHAVFIHENRSRGISVPLSLTHDS